MDALAGAIHNHRARPVEKISRGHLLGSSPQTVFHRSVAGSADPAMDRKNSPDAYVGIDIRRTVERVIDQHIVALGKFRRYAYQVGTLLGNHYAEVAAVVHRPVDGVLRNPIQAPH